MKYDIVILGSGESGVGSALLAQAQGLSVLVSDGSTIPTKYVQELQQANIAYEQGGHSTQLILQAAEVIKSPGIPDKAPIIQAIKQQGINIISEIEFGYRYKGNSKIVAITGSNGKTTTTNLTYHIFKTAGYSVSMCGNVGYSFARQICTAPTDWYVIETSSFQLDDIKTFKPNISVLLNITPDHLDRYNYQFSNYVASKFKVAMNQNAEDFFIVCADDEAIQNQIKQSNIKANILYFTMNEHLNNQAGSVANNQLVIDVNGDIMEVPTNELRIKGRHNIYNSLASGISARVAEIRKEKIREALTSFESLEHRLESVATVRGVEFINDSKATNINSVWYALESMAKPTILILGGIDKGNDYNQIAELVKQKVKAIVCLGVDNTKIHTAFAEYGMPVADAVTAQQAVELSYSFAEKGDVVLLSPACASFDLFANYEDRGQKFKEAVRNM
jgi:UDP-N-acetylmuramoylalanine--D-glutamate ligase